MAHTLLVVEDDQDVRELLAFVLSRRTGHSVVTAADGGAALDLLERGLRPCFIVLDLRMPGVDGYGVRRAQVADPSLRDIPTVIMTGVDEIEPMPGVLALIQKPIDVDRLVEMVNGACPA